MSRFLNDIRKPTEQAGCFTRRCALAILIAEVGSAALASPTLAQVTIPRPGTPLRSSILDALRPSVAAEIGGDIEFAVSEIRVLHDWAYVSARPQRPGGKPIDWRATKFRKDWEDDAMSDLVLALLRRQGDGWKVVEYAIGPTDVAWEEWIKPYGIPRRLFIDE